MNRAQLLVVLHAHQPVGRSDEVVAAAHVERYRPALEALLAAPSVRLTVHFSGALLEWLQSDAPETGDLLHQLSERGQIEMLGGGAYEPLLTLLSDWDAQNQLQKMKELVEAVSVGAPTGAWLTEGVYEADLPRVLGPAGFHHAVLASGPEERRALGYTVTERAGNPLALFTIDPVISRLLAEGNRDGLLAELSAAADTAPSLSGHGACAALDLDRADPQSIPSLIAGLADVGAATDLLTLADYRAQFTARASSRRGSAGPDLLRAGAHLAARPDAAAFHTRMLHASKKLLEAEAEVGVGTGSLADARRALQRGQGHFDLDETRLRHAAYAHLIESENLADADQRDDGDYIEYEEDDFDADLRDEAVLANAQLAAWVDPNEGGALTELDDRAHALAHVQVLPRDGAIARHSFVDRFASATETLEQVASNPGADLGSFATGPYVVEASGVDEEGDLSASITLMREGTVRTEDGPRSLLIEKTYHVPVDAPRLEVEYILENPGEAPLQLLFAPELHLCPFGGDTDSCAFDLGDNQRVGLGSPVNLGTRSALVLRDSEAGTRLSLGADQESEIWAYPVRRTGVYQGTCVVLRQAFTLPPKESRRVRFTVQITDLE